MQNIGKEKIIIATVSIALAGSITFFILKGEVPWREYQYTLDKANTLDIEHFLDNCEKTYPQPSSIAKVLQQVTDLNDEILSKGQMRRKYMLLGDIYLTYFLDTQKHKHRQFNFDLATKFYAWAEKYSDSEEEKLAIKRRNARLYYDNKNWRLALFIFQKTETYSMAPQERWRLRFLQAKCQKNLGKNFAAYELLNGIAEESGTRENVWAEAVRMKADIEVEVSSSPEKIVDFTRNRAKALNITIPDKQDVNVAKIQKELRQSAELDYEKIIEVMPLANRDAAGSKVGILDLNVIKALDILRKKTNLLEQEVSIRLENHLTSSVKKKLDAQQQVLSEELKKQSLTVYATVNRLNTSSMPAVEKARTLVILGELESARMDFEFQRFDSLPKKERKARRAAFKRANHHCNKAIMALRKCLQRYPNSKYKLEVAMGMFRLFKKFRNSEEWHRAFDIAENIFLNTPEPIAIKTLLKEFMPNDGTLIMLIAEDRNKKHFLKRTRGMFNSLEINNPDIWQGIKDEASFIMAELIFLSDRKEHQNIKNAENNFEICLNTPGFSQELTEYTYYMETLCAVERKASPAIKLARADRYINSFPSGKFFREMLLVKLVANYELGLYDDAVTIFQQLYFDHINDDKKGLITKKREELFLQAVAKIVQCFTKLKEHKRSDTWVNNYSDRLLSKPYAPKIFLIWANDAELKGQLNEAIRRLELILVRAYKPDNRAKLIVSRYLLKLLLNEKEFFFKSESMLVKIKTSKKISDTVKKNLRRKLYEGMLEYAFIHIPNKVNPLVAEVVKEFSDENWPEYWVLRSLTPMFKAKNLEVLSSKHEEILKNNYAYKSESTDTFDFIKKQLGLINSLVSIEDGVKKLKEERDL